MTVVGFGCASCSETHGQSLWSGEDFKQGSEKFYGGVSPADQADCPVCRRMGVFITFSLKTMFNKIFPFAVCFNSHI